MSDSNRHPTDSVETASKASNRVSSQRILSLDVLRGFSMFWLIGGSALITELARIAPINALDSLAQQFEHASWAGLRFYDMIFPIFIFTSGATIPFTIKKLRQRNTKSLAIARKALSRACALLLIGTLYNEWYNHDFNNPRICSVLGQIGVSYFISSCIYLASPKKLRLIAAAAGIMILTMILQTKIPGATLHAKPWLSAALNPNNSINSYIDTYYMPGRLLNKSFDPEGPLNWISASAVCTLGAWTSTFFQPFNSHDNNHSSTNLLLPALTGSALIAGGLIADSHYPIIKQLWTSSFCAVAGGASILLCLLLYIIIDIHHINRIFYPFTILGANSLLAYVAIPLFSYSQFSHAAGNHISGLLAINTSLTAITLSTAITLFLLHTLYKHKVFIRI